ncbi:beta-galactosidase GalA [Oleiharenicola lentus]|uniref:beta-galactosidase GalA n=1 Tax=Oleiharenicola lentus TaxID=2508720 RepID=UPI003F6645BB
MADRERLLLDFGWRFQLGDPTDLDPAVFAYPEVDALERTALAHLEAEPKLVPLRKTPEQINAAAPVSFAQPNFDDRAWRQPNLPHDWAVELPFNPKALRNHGYKNMGAGVGAQNSWEALEMGQSAQALGGVTGNTIGWYRRTFELSASDRGSALWLEFDGIYRNALIWLNGHCLTRHVSGFSSFKVDIAPHANYSGKNTLVVRVDATRTEGWYYEGAGIYRHTWLVKTAPMHVAHWGTFVTSELHENGAAVVTAQTTVRNDSSATAEAVLISRVLDTAGQTVAENTTAPFALHAGNETIIPQSLPVATPALWSPETPHLYRLVSEVRVKGSADKNTDRYETNFGIRTIRFDSEQGFLLNGKKYVIRGVGVHQDHAGVGVAVPDAVQEFRIRRLKEMGVNTYRTAHHPHSPAILEACDRLGMLVVNENRRFDDTPETLSQVERLIRRDRNHPSVVLWSLGNEEFKDQMQGEPWGQPIAKKIQHLVKTLDPSRPTMMPMNGDWGKGFSHVVDVMGFNYLKLGDADKFHVDHPHIPAISSEESSAVSTRGVYIEDRVRAHVTAYGTKVPPWGSRNEVWLPYFEARPWVAGVLMWAAFDWRGEQWPYDWPAINCQFGVLDTCGFPKDSFYFLQAWWSQQPVLHILPHWNWAVRDQEPIQVRVYSNFDEVELFLNDKSLGRKAVPRGGFPEWPVIYQAGVLRADGYRAGQLEKSTKVETTGPSATLTLTPDRATIRGDGEDCAIVTVSAIDSEGRMNPTANETVEFEISGPGKIIGVGNGDPSSHESDKGRHRSLFNGYAQVIVQADRVAGPITLIARSLDGVREATLTINAQAVTPRPATK